MNDEGLVAIFTDHLIKKAVAGAALLIEDASLAQAGVDEQAQGQWKIGLATEVMNRLRAAILSQGEILFAQVVDDFSGFVADRGQDIDHIHLDGNLRREIRGIRGGMARLSRRRILGESKRGHRENPCVEARPGSAYLHE